MSTFVPSTRLGQAHTLEHPLAHHLSIPNAYAHAHRYCPYCHTQPHSHSAQHDHNLKQPVTTVQEEETRSECFICKEDIFDIISMAERDKKGGIEGCLVIWTCELKNCGVLFCIFCAKQWTSPSFLDNRKASSSCPACTREWDISSLKKQYQSYQSVKFEWRNELCYVDSKGASNTK
ncbi:uncharacterized protein IL334_001141 [Kwoniella shivajii]|uniref:RING-type domain-containing protein n=1 Tax=Kwoniella shivajii TaxID=564305 RepID=A0ABZ1CVB6_9TREE|nr:hypothetical protein IL334_001141 [Kwoniella shivajii]